MKFKTLKKLLTLRNKIKAITFIEWTMIALTTYGIASQNVYLGLGLPVILLGMAIVLKIKDKFEK